MLVSVNGVRTAPEDAQVSVFDRGLLFGDAIYDVVATRGGELHHLDEHLDRLQASGDAIGLDIRPIRGQIEGEIKGLLAELAQSPEGGRDRLARVLVTRGACPDLALDTVEGPLTWIVYAKPLPAPFAGLNPKSIKLVSVRPDLLVARISPGVKSNNRQANVMAHLTARAQGADDGLFVDPENNLGEGPTWNVFCVFGEEVATPPLEHGILAGLTRRHLLELCAQAGVTAHERPIPLSEAEQADELFITSTTRGVMPVSELNGRALPAPGPLTTRLGELLGKKLGAAAPAKG